MFSMDDRSFILDDRVGRKASGCTIIRFDICIPGLKLLIIVSRLENGWLLTPFRSSKENQSR
jgi:hypothetical protein